MQRHSQIGRILAAFLVAIIFIVALYFDWINKTISLFSLLLLIFATGALIEFYNMCRAKGFRPVVFPSVLALVLLLIIKFFWIEYFYESVFSRKISPLFGWLEDFFWDWEFKELETCSIPITKLRLIFGALYCFTLLLIALLWSRKFNGGDILISICGLLYIYLISYCFDFVYILGWAANRYCHYIEPLVFVQFSFILLLLANKVTDSCAYIFGNLIGGPRLIPSISPAKTWSGFILGIVSGVYICWVFIQHSPLSKFFMEKQEMFIFIFILPVASQLGDLFASAVKRWAGVKDSSKALGPLGGFLDLIDGFLVSAPVGAILLPFLLATPRGPVY